MIEQGLDGLKEGILVVRFKTRSSNLILGSGNMGEEEQIESSDIKKIDWRTL